LFRVCNKAYGYDTDQTIVTLAEMQSVTNFVLWGSNVDYNLKKFWW